MNKFLKISFLFFFCFSLYSAENLTDAILNAYLRKKVLSDINIYSSPHDPTTDGQELIKLKTKVPNLKPWLQTNHTELENKTLIGLIGAAIKSAKDDSKSKKKFLAQNTRCAYDKEIGTCNCVTVVTKEYFDSLKNTNK